MSGDVTFPEGSVLLWGNIGSGKSSVLLAIDFAFFGLQGDMLSGATLLRNGADKGSVTLSFTLDGEDIIVQRRLKRTKNGVTQDSGMITRHGVPEEKTAIELKQIILDVLQYPPDLLTKNKDVIYRYTVYTPQEEMKRILLAGKEERLNTLRKVFGIDKYKQIRDNAKVVLAHLRERKRMYEGMLADLPEKIVEKEKKEKEKKSAEDARHMFLPVIEEKHRLLIAKKDEIATLEIQREAAQQIKKDLAVCYVSIKHKEEEVKKDSQKISRLKEEIAALPSLEQQNSDFLKEKILALEQEMAKKETEIREMLNKIQELKTLREHALHTRQRVENLNTCPTCFQDVSSVHKQTIIEKSQQEIQTHEQHMLMHEQQKNILDEHLRLVKETLASLRKKEQDMHILAVTLRQAEQKKQEHMEMEKRIAEEQKTLDGLRVKSASLEKQLESFSSLDSIHLQLRASLEVLEQEYKNVEMEKHRYDTTVQFLTQHLTSITHEIDKKMRVQQKKEYINSMHFWMSETFIPMIEAMEKNVMFSVHSEFNALFEKWFTLLVDTQTLRISLDEEFSPKILQDGYDTEYTALSGGEKTAAALAYRLALNQIVNNLHAGIKTSDLLILDEPTDGFSQEQLDRLRTLMDEIDIPQIILVSHEPQIESFVDTVLRFEKVGNETRLLS